MPRIRSLKPEHRQHRKVGPLTDRQYRLWVSMILEADDKGRLVADAAQLKACTWPYHPRVTVSQVEDAILTLAQAGRVRLYEVAGVRYAVFPKWSNHQHPKYPTPSRIPPPEGLPQDSPSPPGAFPQDSPRSREVLSRESREEGRGVERGVVGIVDNSGSTSNQPDPARKLAAVKAASSPASFKEYAAGVLERVTGQRPEA